MFMSCSLVISMPVNKYYHILLAICMICRGLVETDKSNAFYLVDRLIHLILALVVSTTQIVHPFSTMKLVKTRLVIRQTMESLKGL